MLYQKSKAKDVIHDKVELNELVGTTIHKMAIVAGATLGPGGRPVLIDRGDLSPLVTKDGVTVIKSMGIADSAKNIVLDAAKEISIGTAKEAGDGTTTAIILADALVQNGQDFLLHHNKYNPQRLVNELRNAFEDIVVPYLRDYAVTAETPEELRNVALISANGDDRIANAVVEAVMAAGDDGKVLIHEGDGDVIEVNHMDGFVVTSGLKDLGQIGPAFINDKTGQQVKMDNGHVVLYDGTLNDLSIPARIQDAVADEAGMTDGKAIIVFAHGFSDLVKDKFAQTSKGGLTVLPIKSPRSGLPNGASMFLHNMAAYTGATVYDPGSQDSIDEDGIGSFEEALVNMYESFIINTPDDDVVNVRVRELKAYESQAFGELDKQHIRASIAKLRGGVSSIVVGGTSELEIREKQHRVEDAVEAVRSAIAEGIVPGGATTMLKIAAILQAHEDHKASWVILEEALQAPFKRLMENCGEDPEVILQKIVPKITLTDGLPSVVFDANRYEVVDPFKAGIIEPAKVCRVALTNALSVASLLTTIGGIVVAPRDSQLENQLELAEASFKNMMGAAGDQ
jgi:chaperonin GroEL